MHHSDAEITGLCCLIFPVLHPGQELRVGRVVGVLLTTGLGLSLLAELATVPWLVKPSAAHGAELCLPLAHPAQGEDGEQRACV